MVRAILCAVLFFGGVAVAAAQDVLFVVRHAERADQSADSPLSSSGVERAKRLASLLRDSGITRIYTTKLKRTIETALHMSSTALDGSTADLLQRLRSAGPSDRILVVGHSNTIPDLLSSLGVVPRVSIGDTDFDNLFIVSPRPAGAPQIVRLRY
jgi:broad specificity phosphatase PhoE